MSDVREYMRTCLHCHGAFVVRQFQSRRKVCDTCRSVAARQAREFRREATKKSRYTPAELRRQEQAEMRKAHLEVFMGDKGDCYL